MRVRRRKGSILVSQSGFEREAINLLRNRSMRVTLPRVQVLRVLDLADRPLSPYGIRDEVLASGGKIDVVSVYRILQTYSELGLVHHVGLAGGYVACRLDQAHETETEHIVCKECGKVTEVALPRFVLDQMGQQLSDLGFKMLHTRMEILAVCPACSA